MVHHVIKYMYSASSYSIQVGHRYPISLCVYTHGLPDTHHGTWPDFPGPPPPYVSLQANKNWKWEWAGNGFKRDGGTEQFKKLQKSFSS